MVRVIMDDAKGLHQKSGNGVDINMEIQTSEGLAVLKEGVSQIGPTGLIVGKDLARHAEADPYTESATQLWPLGTRLVYGDREFRYVKMASSGVTAGKLLQNAVHQGADHLDMNITSGDVPAIGDYRISLETNGTNLTLNQYAEGYIYVNDGTGEGQLMKIKSHPAHTHGDDATCVFTLYDPVTVALVAGGTSKVTIHQSKYTRVIVSPTSETGSVLGATVRNMTADYFGWVQVQGPAAVLTNGTIVVGNNVTRGQTVAGSVEAAPDAVSSVVGEVMAVNANGDYSLIYLRLG